MSAPPLLRSSALVLVFVCAACHEANTDGQPQCVPVDVAGTWDVGWVDNGTGACFNVPRVWTLSQSGCVVTIAAESWDPANGATGSARDGRLYVEWTWYEGCRGIRETVDASVTGDTMNGSFYRVVWQQVYPADCPGTGICSSGFAATRRNQASRTNGLVEERRITRRSPRGWRASR